MNTYCRIKRSSQIAALVTLISCFAIFNVASATSNESLVPFLTSPQDDAATARADDMIIVVMFEYDDCPWCEYVLTSEIEPTIRSQAFQSSVLFRRADISDTTEIPAFNGSPTSTSQLAKSLGISMSPTLVFLNADGKALAPALIGVSSRDFYGYYLEKRINDALDALTDS